MQPPAVTKDSAYFENDLLHVFTPVQYTGRNFGHVYMRILPEYLQQKRQEYYLVFGFGIPVLLVLSYLLAVGLHPHLSRPIITLTRQMEKISSEQDYSTEVKSDESHEIGSLYNSFNSLLKTIHSEQNKQQQGKEELELHRDHLEELVQERTAELKTLNKELESFCHSVSHDLRAPLRAIDGFSLAVLEDYADKLDAEGQEHLQRVRGGAQRMGELIDDLLMLSQVSRAEMHRHTVDLCALSATVMDRLEQSESSRKVEQVVAPGVNVQGDRNLLEIVMDNLLSNAWKYTGKTEDPRIEFGVKQQDGKSVYFVKDNGVGFDMKYAEKLFGAFQRLHKEEDFPGTGVGLATVQRIVHRHGGRIWAEAKEGKGATFFFTLGEDT